MVTETIEAEGLAQERCRGIEEKTSLRTWRNTGELFRLEVTSADMPNRFIAGKVIGGFGRSS